MPYRYDLHCHTREGSRCSDIAIPDMAQLYHELGYAGFCIADHFTGRMNPLPDDAPWADRVSLFFDIHESARAEAAKYELTVFGGIEFALLPDIDCPSQTAHAHFLFLNLSKEWLTANKDAFREKPEDLFAHVRAAGGFVIHAHPMHGGELRLYPYAVDAVEVINGGVDDACNDNAKTYANMYGLAQTAGTDLHRYDHRHMAGVETDAPCRDAFQLIDAIKTGRAKPFSMAREIADDWQQKQIEASEVRKNGA